MLAWLHSLLRFQWIFDCQDESSAKHVMSECIRCTGLRAVQDMGLPVSKVPVRVAVLGLRTLLCAPESGFSNSMQ